MGRLNYTHRKIEGTKLGQVVAKDLVKRIPPNSGFKAAFRDPVVEVDVSGKDLTDEGFFEVASALVEALKYHGDHGKVARLEELCLRDARLSAASLPALSQVIKLAPDDLRDLDLSGNSICIDTEDTIVIWEAFLSSLNECCVLRRLDFSRNPLGPKAFEVLTKVYANESPINPELSTGISKERPELQSPCAEDAGSLRRLRKISIASTSSDATGDGDSDTEDSQTPMSSSSVTFPSVQADFLQIYRTTTGIRAVPYIVFSDTAMTETCALHLSYVVASHYLPERLMSRAPSAKAGAAANQLAAYENDSKCRGIIYQSNASLGKTGLKVLELAEELRGVVSAEAEGDAVSVAEQHAGSATLLPPRQRKYSVDGYHEDRLESLLDRARSKIQLNMLSAHGPFATELWQTSLRMLCMSRQIQQQKKNEPTPASERAPASDPPIPVQLAPPPESKVRGSIIKTLPAEPSVGPRLKPKITPLTLERDPNKPMKPSNPWNTNFSTHSRNKSVDTLSIPTIIPPTPRTPATINGSYKAPDISKFSPPEPHAPMASTRYRTDLPYGLPEDTWRRILSYAIDADGIMSIYQQQAMFRWAMDRGTLKKEVEHLGSTKAGQIWRVLEGTGCLGYEIDV